MIISDVTMRRVVCNNIDDLWHVVEHGLREDKVIRINGHKEGYEIDLISKVGDYFKK